MFTLKRTVISTMILLLTCVQSLWGHFEDLGQDARARGMANAMVSIYGGINSVHYNPAGTSRSRKIEVNFMWDKPLTMTELNDGSTFNKFNGGVLMPFTGGLNLAWLYRWIFTGLTLGNEDFMFKDGATAITYSYNNLADLTTEQLITLNYSRILDNVLFKGARLSFGFNFDFYFLKFNTDLADWSTLPDNPSSSVFAFGLDFGAIYNFSDTITLGVVFDNLVPPNFSAFSDGEDKKPMDVKLGGSIFFDKFLFFENLTVAVNYIKYGKYDDNDNTAAKTSWHYGFESWWFDNMFAFRGGFMMGDNENNELSLGTSFQMTFSGHELMLDYAFTLPLNVEGERHLLTLTWKWGLPKYKFVYDKKKAAEMKRLADLQAQQQNQAQSKKTNTTDTKK